MHMKEKLKALIDEIYKKKRKLFIKYIKNNRPWEDLGYSSPEDMLNDASPGDDEQVLVTKTVLLAM